MWRVRIVYRGSGGMWFSGSRTERTQRDLTSTASPKVPVATKRMCIVDRT